jgi:hypothetical protein
LTVAPVGTACGSLNGKYNGNQLNIPTEKVVGAILITEAALVFVRLWYRTQWNVPKKP